MAREQRRRVRLVTGFHRERPRFSLKARGLPDGLTAMAGDLSDRLLLIPEVAHELGVSEARARALVSAGQLPAFKLAGHWRVERWALEEYVTQLSEAFADERAGSTR